MNKKKLLFLIWLWIFVFILIIIAFIISNSSTKKTKKASATNFKIWILDDNKDDFTNFIEDFKKDKKYSSFSPQIESFSNYEEYYLALASAFAKGEAPDIFMLNNNEKSLFLESISWIDPNIISPDDLRSYFKWFFGDDLIYSVWDKDNKKEFLIGVPAWYETLWVFFNFRKIQDIKKFKNFSYLETLINDKAKEGFSVLGLWDASTTKYAWDIFGQFLMSIGINDIKSLSDSELKQALASYYEFYSWKNNYKDIAYSLKIWNKNNIDAFADWKIWAIFAYPRTLSDIDERWFNKVFLRATSFPDFINDSKFLVNYNYFVINKNTKNMDMALEFLKYLFSEKWEKKYLLHFKYYLPARLSIYEDIKDRDILEPYHIKLKNFYKTDAIYSSFDKGIKYIYDNNIKNILDYWEYNKKTPPVSFCKVKLKFICLST